MHVKTKLLARILGLASPQIRRNRKDARFALVLTTEEGIACRFAAGTWNDSLLNDIASELTSQIGWKRIEHAPGRQVLLHCIAPGSDAEQARCEVDLGSGFEGLTVRSERA